MSNKQEVIKRLEDLKQNIRKNHEFCMDECNQIDSIINFINKNL